MNRNILKFILIGTTNIFSPTKPVAAAACATPAINHEKLGTLARLPDVAYHRIGLVPLLSDAILPYIFAQTLKAEKEKLTRELESLQSHRTLEIAEKQQEIEAKQHAIEKNTLAIQALNPDDLPFLDLSSLAILARTNQALRAQMQANLAAAKKYLMTWKVAQITHPGNLVDNYLLNIKGVKSPTDQAIVFGQMLQILFPLPDRNPYKSDNGDGDDYELDYPTDCTDILDHPIIGVSFYSKIPHIYKKLEKIHPNLSLFLWHIMCLYESMSPHPYDSPPHTCSNEALYRAILNSPFANPESLYLMLRSIILDVDYHYTGEEYNNYLVSNANINRGYVYDQYIDNYNEDDDYDEGYDHYNDTENDGFHRHTYVSSSAASASAPASAAAPKGIPLHEIFSVQRIKDFAQHPHVKPEHLWFLLQLPAELFRDPATISIIVNRIINHPNITVDNLLKLLSVEQATLIDTATKLRIVDKIIHHPSVTADQLLQLFNMKPDTLIDQATKIWIIYQIIHHPRAQADDLLKLLSVEPNTLIDQATKRRIIDKIIHHPSVTAKSLLALLKMQPDTLIIDPATKLIILNKIIHHSHTHVAQFFSLLRMTPDTLIIDPATKLRIIDKIIHHPGVTVDELLELLNMKPDTLINKENKISIIEKIKRGSHKQAKYRAIYMNSNVDVKYRLELLKTYSLHGLDRYFEQEIFGAYLSIATEAYTYNDDGSLQPAELERFQAAEELYHLHKEEAIKAYTLLAEDTTISSANKAKALAELERIKAEVAAQKAKAVAERERIKARKAASVEVPSTQTSHTTTSTYAACAAAAEGIDD